MGTNIEVKILGMPKVMNVLENLDKDVGAVLKHDLKTKIAIPIRDEAKRNCPVYPVKGGSLKKSGRLEVTVKPKGKIYQIKVRFGGYITNPRTGRKVDYAKFVEDGTSRMSAQPFLGPAVVKIQFKINRLLRDAVNSVVMVGC